MEDNSFDPRTWVDPQEGDPRSDAIGFALTSGGALRLWLVSALILAVAGAGAWSTRGAKDARLGRPAPAPTEQAPAP